MSFIIIAAAMFLAALGFIAIPLLKQQRAAPLQTAAANRAIHDARVDELKADVAAGALAEADYAAARRDLEADFAETSVAPETAARRSRGWIAAVAVVAIVPILTAALYLNLGSWRSALFGNDSLPAMIANVSTRLQEAPNDASGWRFLGQAYSIQERYRKAADAYRHAVALTGGNNATDLVELGSVEMLARQMQAGPEQARLFDKALQLEPNNTKALLFGGIVALQQGDNETAVARWQKVLQQNPPAQLRKILAARIAAAGGTVEPASAPSGAVAAGPSIPVHVTLAPTLNAAVPANATLFVFVRPVDGKSGPPLAVQRLNVDQFPVQVKLSDADAMIPGRHLKDYERLQVVARISKSGAPLAQTGDIYGTATFTWQDPNAPLDIVLNEVVRQ
ncbi:MAG TPA: c-type cytochrome biogenesis protein CcmI [Gammaproteobacteria bacterium]|nr:c-type cytochrome biogenesis protein CcmI [Gammaproteobacteria bacterium]